MPSSSSTCRFGDYAFDPASGELTGPAGVARLQPQVAALLNHFTAHAGAVITRTELQERLWPDTTVEFDDGLNFCIRQLRVALADDANQPTYIETLPRRGYRFLPVVTRGAVPAAQVAQPVVPVDAAPERWRAWRGAAVLVVLAATIAGVLAWRAHARAGATDGVPVVLGILPFSADTSDSLVAAYRRRLYGQITADARAEHAWTVAGPGATPTHLLAGSLARDQHGVKIFVQLVDARDRHKLWADDLVDLYAFEGNSTVTADRIEKSVARILADTARR